MPRSPQPFRIPDVNLFESVYKVHWGRYEVEPREAAFIKARFVRFIVIAVAIGGVCA
jgi:hypothetical protein